MGAAGTVKVITGVVAGQGTVSGIVVVCCVPKYCPVPGGPCGPGGPLVLVDRLIFALAV
jgi:hypothetical protein